MLGTLVVCIIQVATARIFRAPFLIGAVVPARRVIAVDRIPDYVGIAIPAARVPQVYSHAIAVRGVESPIRAPIESLIC
jgi:hypothetical protein